MTDLPAEAMPAWMANLAAAVSAARPEHLSRFALPEGQPARASAVLMLVGEGEHGPDLLLTRRAATMRSHSGQPAFPGGTQDRADADARACALREAHEEVGVDPASVVTVAQLPPIWVPVTGFLVTAVLGWWATPGPIAAAEAEVAAVYRVPIAELADPTRRVRVRHPSGYIGPGFEVDDMIVWGFTGGLTDALIRMGGWERPWLPNRLVDIDSELT